MENEVVGRRGQKISCWSPKSPWVCASSHQSSSRVQIRSARRLRRVQRLQSKSEEGNTSVKVIQLMSRNIIYSLPGGYFSFCRAVRRLGRDRLRSWSKLHESCGIHSRINCNRDPDLHPHDPLENSSYVLDSGWRHRLELIYTASIWSAAKATKPLKSLILNHTDESEWVPNFFGEYHYVLHPWPSSPEMSFLTS